MSKQLCLPKILIVTSLLLIISACASVTVDTSTANFDEEKYAEDLDTCRGGTAAETTLHGLGGVLAGSLFGASEGFTHMGFSGGSAEGAVIGAIVGGTVGLFVGAYKPIETQGEKVRSCLRGKGYSVSS
jgi:hypothetical protein